jgi:hypothetical protein
MKQPTENRSEARVVPAAVVAHLERWAKTPAHSHFGSTAFSATTSVEDWGCFVRSSDFSLRGSRFARWFDRIAVESHTKRLGRVSRSGSLVHIGSDGMWHCFLDRVCVTRSESSISEEPIRKSTLKCSARRTNSIRVSGGDSVCRNPRAMTPKPNKAPEPTSTSVMPRAILSCFEMKQRTELPNQARVTPAAAVAHL